MSSETQPPYGEKLSPSLEDAWLQRYLDRELSQQEEFWFESYALDKPRLLDAIERDTDLRDGLHAWHAEQGRNGAVTADATDAAIPASTGTSHSGHTVTTESPQPKPASWFKPFAIASGLALAVLLGASAYRWMLPTDATEASVATPSRLMFDVLGGSGEPSVSEQSTDLSAPVLIDVTVSPHAEAVIAYFADHSSMALPVSRKGVVSLIGSRSALLNRSPIRIAWRLDGQQQERVLDLKASLTHHDC